MFVGRVTNIERRKEARYGRNEGALLKGPLLSLLSLYMLHLQQHLVVTGALLVVTRSY